jgi:hypothetical protein
VFGIYSNQTYPTYGQFLTDVCPYLSQYGITVARKGNFTLPMQVRDGVQGHSLGLYRVSVA